MAVGVDWTTMKLLRGWVQGYCCLLCRVHSYILYIAALRSLQLALLLYLQVHIYTSALIT